MNPTILLLAFQVVGMFTSIVFKEQSRCVVEGQNFNHPFMQSMTMYIGEALCMFFYMGYLKFYKESNEKSKQIAIQEGKKTYINPFLLCIPTACDFVTSTLSFFALEFMPASLYSMIRGGGLVVTTIFSVVFLKRKLFRHHLLGLTIIVSGLVTVGIIVTLNSSSSGSDTQKILIGIILLLCSFFTFSTQIIIEEKFFHQYHLNPFQTVGLEGCWGILICGVFVAIFNFVPCPDAIVSDCPPNKNLEDVSFFFKQVFTIEGTDQPMLISMVFIGIVLILFFNAISLAITKYASSLARNVAQVCSPFFVWMLSLIFKWEDFLYGQLLGFIVLAFGTLIFYEILVIPFWGFNTNTKKAIAARKLLEEKEALITSGDESKLNSHFENEVQ